MRIYVMRHGYAGDYSGKRDVDDKRKLQPDGIDAVKAMAAWMADSKHNEVPTCIVCSPIQRALDTARLMSDAFGLPFSVDQNLEKERPMEMFIKKCAADKGIRRPLLISHSDNIVPGLARLNYLARTEVDPIAMAELRILKVDRDSVMWKEKNRILPSDNDCIDFY
jgi:phosphohistidine phosphatase SixA